MAGKLRILSRSRRDGSIGFTYQFATAKAHIVLLKGTWENGYDEFGILVDSAKTYELANRCVNCFLNTHCCPAHRPREQTIREIKRWTECVESACLLWTYWGPESYATHIDTAKKGITIPTPEFEVIRYMPPPEKASLLFQ